MEFWEFSALKQWTKRFGVSPWQMRDQLSISTLPHGCYNMVLPLEMFEMTT